MADTPFRPLSENSRRAFERFDAVVEEIRYAAEHDSRPRMPKVRSLEDFFKERRDRGDDVVFTSENPGP